MSKTYRENARHQLKRDLPHHLSRDIENELKRKNFHYLPTLRSLEVSTVHMILFHLMKQFHFLVIGYTWTTLAVMQLFVCMPQAMNSMTAGTSEIFI